MDSMIAVRMRVTGHNQSDIEGVIRQCAPATRQNDEGRDWNNYAQRTARYAYSAAGDRQASELVKYRQQEQTKARQRKEHESLTSFSSFRAGMSMFLYFWRVGQN